MATVRLNLDAVKRDVAQAVGVGITACAQAVASQAMRSMTRGDKLGSRSYQPSAPGQPPSIQSGHLRRSITARQIGPAEAVAGTSVLYGRVLEYGGVIRPRKSKYLTIPISPLARKAAAGGLGAGSMPGLFPIKSKKGNLLLVRGAKGGGIEPMYALKKRVRIRPRPWLRPALRSVEPTLEAVFAKYSKRALRKFTYQRAGAAL